MLDTSQREPADLGRIVDGLWSPLSVGQVPPEFGITTDFLDSSGRAINLRSYARSVMEMRIALPDHKSIVEDALTAPTGENSGFALVRVRHLATHSGAGVYGPPSMAQVHYRSVLELLIEDGQLVEAGLVTDTQNQLTQLGHSAKTRAEPRAGPKSTLPPSLRKNSDPWGAALADILTSIMDGDLSVIHQCYDPAAELTYPIGHRIGAKAADQFWLSLRAAVPTGTFHISTQIGNEDPLRPPRTALKWTLTGTHDGWGRFGAPTGARLHIIGMTFVEFGPRGVRREWTVIDELAIWQQILSVTSSSSYRATG